VKTAAERFAEKVGTADANGCMNWQGSLNMYGYGQFSIGHKTLRAHRYAYFLHYNVDPGKNLVMHKCDNKACVNPEHLELGTHAENVKQAYDRGLSIRQRGEKSHLAKLTDKEVEEIRCLLLLGVKQRGIAKRYGVTQSCISRIATQNRRVAG